MQGMLQLLARLRKRKNIWKRNVSLPIRTFAKSSREFALKTISFEVGRRFRAVLVASQDGLAAFLELSCGIWELVGGYLRLT